MKYFWIKSVTVSLPLVNISGSFMPLPETLGIFAAASSFFLLEATVSSSFLCSRLLAVSLNASVLSSIFLAINFRWAWSSSGILPVFLNSDVSGLLVLLTNPPVVKSMLRQNVRMSSSLASLGAVLISRALSKIKPYFCACSESSLARSSLSSANSVVSLPSANPPVLLLLSISNWFDLSIASSSVIHLFSRLIHPEYPPAPVVLFKSCRFSCILFSTSVLALTVSTVSPSTIFVPRTIWPFRSSLSISALATLSRDLALVCAFFAS